MKAYPIMYKHPTTGLIVEELGMELRDWFAGMAMSTIFPDVAKELQRKSHTQEQVDLIKKAASEACYGIADAMIKAREIKDD